MRPFLASVVAALLLGAGAGGQQPAKDRKPAKPQAPRPGEGLIRAFADLVLIDVQVTDGKGHPVRGLKPEQFSVSEDDTPQKISSFDYYDIEAIEKAAATEARPLVVSLGTVAAPEKVREAVRDRRMVVLFFDLTSLQPDQLLRALDAAQQYLRQQMTPADLVAVVALGNRFGVLANFTNDREQLLRAVARLRPGKESQLAEPAEAAAPAGEEAVVEETGAAFTADWTEFNVFNTDRKLAALEGLCDLLRGIPGRKAVIHFTAGVTQTGQENRSQLRAATDAANRANVSLYTVDTRGLEASVPGGEARAGAAGGAAMYGGAAVFRQAGARHDSRETLETLAHDTRGRSFFDTGDFREVFEKVQQDGSGYYLLGYYSSNAQRDGRWRRVRVRVNAPDARLRAREGYYAPKDYGHFTSEDRERQLEEAMRAETPRVELPLALETGYFRLGENEIFVPISAKLASSAVEWAEKRGRREAEFDFAAEVREQQSGGVVAALRDMVRVRLGTERAEPASAQPPARPDAIGARAALVYQGGVILGPGAYRVKFLARENETGRMGTFEQDLVLPPAERERLELSSLLLSSQLEAVTKPGAQGGGAEVKKTALGSDAKMERSPLEVGGERIIPSVTRVFTTQQKLYLLFQAYAPAKAELANLRAGLVLFRNGERASETPLVEPAEVDSKKRTAVFRISLPLEPLAPGNYTVQAVAVEAGGTHAAFARNSFVLRPPASAARPRPGGY